MKRSIRRLVKKIARKAGHGVYDQHEFTYAEDGLITKHSHEFMRDPAFVSAYERGVKACEKDHKFRWRVHVALWAASSVKHLPGDFVECGVNKGFLSSAIMAYLNWNTLDKHFYLFDTFCGLDPKYVSEEEKAQGRLELNRGHYSECFEEAKANFAEFDRVHLVRGSIADTLPGTKIGAVCYLSIDMNCAEPEITAAHFFWDKLVSGGMVLLDDYAFAGYQPQKSAFDTFALEKGVKILSLPTGQGLFIKP